MTIKVKLAWDVDIDATKAAMERLMRALVCTKSHFTDAYALAPIDVPTRGVSVFFRVHITEGQEQRFLAMAKLDLLRPPPRIQVGMDYVPREQRAPIKRAP